MKRIFTSLFSIGLILLSYNNSNAQKKAAAWCQSDEHNELLQQQNPALIQQEQELEDYIANFKTTFDPTAKKTTIIIPVVVHNITHDGGLAYVDKATIEAAINRLNLDYKRLNSDAVNTRALFAPYAATFDIEFRLARLDPNGNCTEGIVRAESPYSLSTSTTMAENVKAVSYWNSKKYFNIWVIDEIQANGDGSFVAGFAQFPSSGINSTYGVVVVNQSFGANDRTLTHELGHCFNLLHTFNYGSCSGSGDLCSDTPPVIQSSFDCDPNRNTCSNDGTFYGGDVVDQWENYMSYAQCQNMFTLQQQTRVIALLNSTNSSTGLAQLWTPANLAFTGTADPYNPTPICIPLGANFTYNKTLLCEGGQVTFNDADTYNATPTLWDWTFVGGTPSSSSTQSPVITYNTAGVYGATYRPGTTAGWASLVSKNNIITVSAILAQYTAPFVEGMENTTSFNNDWSVNTLSGNGWQNVNTAGYTGSRSAKINNLTNAINDVSELISPAFDLTSVSNPTLDFKIAYAKKTTGGNEILTIASSIDCGASWQTITLKSASTMSSATATNSAFTPTGQAQWKNHTATINATLATKTNVRFKFALKSNGGNNIYIDDININGTVGVDEAKLVNNLTVYPNPTTESAALSFNLISNVKTLRVTLKDVLGKEVTSIINGQAFAAGRYTLSVDQGKKLAPGLYFIEFNADNKVTVEKLVVK